jgi:predicted N-acetyltransferase YhbS
MDVSDDPLAHLELVEFGPLTAELQADVEGDEPDPFDMQGVELEFLPKPRHVGLRDRDGRLIASTGLLVVEVEVAAERFPVVGFGGVIVNAHHRGRGLGRAVVQAALTRAQTMGPAFALLFCHPNRAGLYRRLDFEQVTAPVWVGQPQGTTRMPEDTMWHPLTPGAAWPAGPVELHSLPF